MALATWQDIKDRFTNLRIRRQCGRRLLARMEAHVHSKQVRRPVGPAQLTLLQQVFDTACQQYKISKDSPDGEALALILVNSLQKGMDEKEALAALAEAMAQSR